MPSFYGQFRENNWRGWACLVYFVRRYSKSVRYKAPFSAFLSSVKLFLYFNLPSLVFPREWVLYTRVIMTRSFSPERLKDCQGWEIAQEMISWPRTTFRGGFFVFLGTELSTSFLISPSLASAERCISWTNKSLDGTSPRFLVFLPSK